MIRTLFARALIPLLVVFVVTSATLFAAPPEAHAGIPVTVDSDFSLSSIGTWTESTISAVANPTTAASTYWTSLKGAVLDPLAHALAQAVLKQITASVVNAINGHGSGGSPLYVQNLGTSLLNISDRAALNFFTEITTHSNSPFAGTIASSLRTNYLQSTSASGFWAANTCTLSSASPNINSFLAGNFGQGGWAAWFSLTTVPQNNPYTLYYRTQSELNARTSGAQAQRTTQLNWAQGFTSWCGGGGGTSGVGQSCADTENSDDCPGELVCVGGSGKGTCDQNSTVSCTTNVQCANDGVTGDTCSVVSSATCQVPTAAQSDAVGGQNCVNKDGTSGTVQTPGTVIMAQLNKTLGSGVDSLVSVHDFDQMVDTILSALATKVVSTGLAALSGSSSGGSSYTSQLANGSSATDPNAASIGNSASTLVQTALTQISTYTSAWQVVQSAANTASTSAVAVLACETAQSVPDSYNAQTALDTEIQPALASAQAAINSASTTQALALQVETEVGAYTSGAGGAGGALTADTQALAAAPPTAADIATAQSASAVTHSATSSDPTSLIVTGGSLVDQMQLIVKNAANALQACQSPITQIL